ncbi:MAG: TIGR03088 family PEP-CTERM/XrtA system glycosyltransferase [Rhodocyclales bacterium]|nr:TIGR03088 family PEP-CTERM/XrtA system glycosyltransferase [Rhodocyclales bacterium]
MSGKLPLHIVHLVYRFSTGGLENVIVQLVNGLPSTQFRHTVVAISDVDATFAKRITQPNVEVIALHKPPGQPFRLYPKMYRLLRRLQADVLHSCNLAAMEFAPIAALARVPLRVHAEHGWDVGELDGHNRRYRFLRQLLKPFVHEFIAVAEPQRRYLQNSIGVASKHLHVIPNGVDTERFHPRRDDDALPAGFPFQRGKHWVIGTIGRQAAVKNPLLLVDSFIQLIQSQAPDTHTLRLVMVGDGPLHESIVQRIAEANVADKVWLAGVRADIPELLRAMDCFVLPSLSEATSCTLQEAMATALPIIATQVGGNAALLDDGRYGSLVPSENVTALAAEMLKQYSLREKQANLAARESIVEQYGLSAVLARYDNVFSRALSPAQRAHLA